MLRRYVLVSQTFAGKTDKVEPWYKVDYSIKKIDPKLIDHWSKLSPVDALHLPSKNEFIPTNFDLVQPAENAPKVPVIIKVSYNETCEESALGRKCSALVIEVAALWRCKTMCCYSLGQFQEKLATVRCQLDCIQQIHCTCNTSVGCTTRRKTSTACMRFKV